MKAINKYATYAFLGHHHSEETKKIISLKNKGKTPWNKGKKVTYITKEHIRKMQKGLERNGRTSQHCARISEALKGNKNSLGKKWSKEISQEGRRNMSIAHIGKTPWNKGLKGFLAGPKNNCWKGGISKNPYPAAFNASLKLEIRSRDDFACQLCGVTELEELFRLGRSLCVNHIDFNKNNCSWWNLNTLCVSCNAKVNHDRSRWTKYFQWKMRCHR